MRIEGKSAHTLDGQALDGATEPVVLHLLGAPFELEPFYAFAADDPVLAELARRLRGFRPPLAPDPFESLVTSITAQQVSLHSAVAIRNRLVECYGEIGIPRKIVILVSGKSLVGLG